ncbi:MAG: hypothetical protein ACYC33_00045 [Thermoleophilia bacterium]
MGIEGIKGEGLEALTGASVEEEEAPADATRARPPGPPFERSLFRTLALVALLCVVVAVGVNLLYGSDDVFSVPGGASSEPATRYEPSLVQAEESSLDLIPADMVSYETITRHAIPGQEDRAAEGIYRTLNMNLEALVAIGNYVRVEAFPSEGDARVRAAALMSGYTLRSADLLLNGVTVARSGYTPDEGALGVAWYRGAYVTFVKTSFLRSIPAQKRTFLHDQLMPVAEAVDLFQRTGVQGIQAAAQGASERPSSEIPGEETPDVLVPDGGAAGRTTEDGT